VVKLGDVKGVFRLRVGDYRVVYRIEDDEVLVLKIGYRGDVYKGRG